MIQKLKSILLTAGAMSVVLFPTLAFASATASAAVDIKGSLCAGTNFNVGGAPDQSCANSTTASSGFTKLLTNIINIFSTIVGVIAVVMIIVGGLRYITSGGDTSRVGAAKTTIIYALVGLVVVALAQLVVHFVLSQSASITG